MYQFVLYNYISTEQELTQGRTQQNLYIFSHFVTFTHLFSDKVIIYLLSGLDLLGPTALCPLLIDFSLLPGPPHILLACTVKQSNTINVPDSKMYKYKALQSWNL